MHEFIDDKGNKLVLTDLEVMLLYEMGFFSSLKNKRIRFNPRPFSNPLHKNSPVEVVDVKKDSVVDFYVEIVNKIDALIEELEKENETEEFDFLPDELMDLDQDIIVSTIKNQL